MRNLFVTLVIFFITSETYAQYELNRSVRPREVFVSVGLNTVNSQGTKNPFGDIGDWGTRIPLSVNAETLWFKQFTIDLGLSLNGYKEGKPLDAAGPPPKNLTYFAIDASLKYYFGEFIFPRTEWFDLYAAAGPGFFVLDDSNISFNLGGGALFWFNRDRTIGIKAQALAKFALNHSNSGRDYANNHFLYQLQAIFKL